MEYREGEGKRKVMRAGMNEDRQGEEKRTGPGGERWRGFSGTENGEGEESLGLGNIFK